MTSKYVERLAFAAHKAATRPEFLAFFLEDYQRQEGLSEDNLLRFLGSQLRATIALLSA